MAAFSFSGKGKAGIVTWIATDGVHGSLKSSSACSYPCAVSHATCERKKTGKKSTFPRGGGACMNVWGGPFPGHARARRVEVGDRLANDELVVIAGIEPGDAVVLDGGFTLKSALLASRLGAGCTDD